MAARIAEALVLMLLAFFLVISVLAAIPSPPGVIGVLMFFLGLIPFVYAWRRPVDNGKLFFLLFVITVIVSSIGLYLAAKYS